MSFASTRISLAKSGKNVDVMMPVQMRELEPRLPGPRDLCGAFVRHLSLIHAPKERAPDECRKREEVAGLRGDETRCASQRPAGGEGEMQTDAERFASRSSATRGVGECGHSNHDRRRS
jgi:hypothetical protein